MYRIRKNAITTEIDKKENRYKKSMHMKKILNDAFAYIDTCYPSKVSNQLIKDIKNSAYYSTFFEIKTWYLKFKWFKNDKRLTILGIPLLREKIKEHKYKIIRILGIKIYKKNINKNKDRLNILKER